MTAAPRSSRHATSKEQCSTLSAHDVTGGTASTPAANGCGAIHDEPHRNPHARNSTDVAFYRPSSTRNDTRYETTFCQCGVTVVSSAPGRSSAIATAESDTTA
jgi:hypothetical protein